MQMTNAAMAKQIKTVADLNYQYLVVFESLPLREHFIVIKMYYGDR